MATEITGRCSCGEVSYVASTEPLMMLKCHCRDCQRATGSAYAALMVFPKEAVVTRGDLRFYQLVGEDGDPIQRGFCPTCGSRMASQLSRIPGVMNVMAGSLDDPSMFKPTVDIYTASAHSWDPMLAETQKFDRGLTG